MSGDPKESLREVYDFLDAYDLGHGRKPGLRNTSLCALFLREDFRDKLHTPEGRAWLAQEYRQRHHKLAAEGGREVPEYVAAAAAIEGADWPALGRILAKVERERWAASNHRIEHLGIAHFARRMLRTKKGGTP